MKRTFTIKAIWDADAHVFVSESDIDGFHIEARTLQEFQDLMHELAIEMIVTNHLSSQEIANLPVKDLIPAIVFEAPAKVDAAA